MLFSNNLYKVLVAHGNSTGDRVLSADNLIENLTPGKIGIFDVDTNKALAAAGAPKAEKIYIATGTGTGDTYKDHDISAGHYIPVKGIKNVELAKYDEGTDQVLKITCKSVLSGVEHSITLEFNNGEIYRRQGYNQFRRVVSTSIDPSEGNANPTAVGDPNLVLRELYISLTKIPEIETKIYESDGSTEKNDLDAVNTYIQSHKVVNTDSNLNNDKILVIKITGKELKKERKGPINLDYYKIRKTFIKPINVFGFPEPLNEIVIEDTPMKHSVGDGYELRQLEYNAGGWDKNPGPYKLYPSIGTTKSNFHYRSKLTSTYNLISINSLVESQEGYKDLFTTHIAFDRTQKDRETTFATINSFIAILNAITGPLGFSDLADLD